MLIVVDVVHQAADMLLFSNKITATEAHRRFLVTKLYADRDFDKEVWADLARIAALPRGVSYFVFITELRLTVVIVALLAELSAVLVNDLIEFDGLEANHTRRGQSCFAQG
jgi:enoyl-CoA hydratase/carnithine racemase